MDSIKNRLNWHSFYITQKREQSTVTRSVHFASQYRYV